MHCRSRERGGPARPAGASGRNGPRQTWTSRPAMTAHSGRRSRERRHPGARLRTNPGTLLRLASYGGGPLPRSTFAAPLPRGPEMNEGVWCHAAPPRRDERKCRRLSTTLTAQAPAGGRVQSIAPRRGSRRPAKGTAPWIGKEPAFRYRFDQDRGGFDLPGNVMPCRERPGPNESDSRREIGRQLRKRLAQGRLRERRWEGREDRTSRLESTLWPCVFSHAMSEAHRGPNRNRLE